MKKVSLSLFAAILFTSMGCSRNSQSAASNSTPAPVLKSVTSTGTTPVVNPVPALPVPSLAQENQHAWRSENVKGRFGDDVLVKQTSLDGRFDLVILQKGTHSFLSFVRHARWESVHNQPSKGMLLCLRVKFEDGQEKRVEWDELGFATEKLYSVLWSYPAKPEAPIGPMPQGPTADSVGGDELFVQEMMAHKTMVLEVEPGVTTQFDMTGLRHEIEKVRTSKTPPVLEAESR